MGESEGKAGGNHSVTVTKEVLEINRYEKDIVRLL